MPDEVFLDFLAAIASAGAMDGGQHDVEEARSAAAVPRLSWRGGGAVMHDIVETTIDTVQSRVRVRTYYPVRDRPLPALVYLHGGGWTLLDIDTHDRLMRAYAAASGFAVIGIDYPRSPEAPYPMAISATVQVLDAIRAEARNLGIQAGRIALGGDSAGANLAVAVALELRDRGVDLAGALLLNYGVYDCDMSRPSYSAYGGPPFVLTAERMAWFWENYCPDPRRRLEGLASPLRANLTGLPPAHLVTAGLDALRDENLAFAVRLMEAGNATSVDHHPRAPHGFLEALAVTDLPHETINRAAAWLREVI